MLVFDSYRTLSLTAVAGGRAAQAVALLAALIAAAGCGAAERARRPTRSAPATTSELSSAGGVGAETPAPQRVKQQLPALTREQLWARYNALRGDAYALDEVPRRLAEDEARPSCDDAELVSYNGELFRFDHTARVHPAFAARLRRFERVVRDVSNQVYGRMPWRLRHLGAFVCRKSRFRSKRISEHAFGNAIDVEGFDFGPAPKSERARLTPALRRGFRVGVKRHWEASDDQTSQTHEEFLRLLTDRLLNEDIFRVALGPSHRGHDNHFHFDMSPWTFVHL